MRVNITPVMTTTTANTASQRTGRDIIRFTPPVYFSVPRPNLSLNQLKKRCGRPRTPGLGSGRSSVCASSCFSSVAHSAGVSVSASTAEKKIDTASVTEN